EIKKTPPHFAKVQRSLRPLWQSFATREKTGTAGINFAKVNKQCNVLWKDCVYEKQYAGGCNGFPHCSWYNGSRSAFRYSDKAHYSSSYRARNKHSPFFAL